MHLYSGEFAMGWLFATKLGALKLSLLLFGCIKRVIRIKWEKRFSVKRNKEFVHKTK